jgi:hypothetical protein
VTYAGSVEQTDESHAEALLAQDPNMRGFLGAVFRPGAEAADKANAAKAASQYATSQTQGLGHDVTTKPGPHTGGHNYLAYQQDELHQMVNTSADSSGVNTQGQSFNSLGNSIAEMTADMDKTTSTAAVSWQGKAAQGGAAFTTGMSSWHGSTAQGAQYAGTRMFEQSQALDQARTNMPPPMAMPTTADVQHALLSYNPLDPGSISTLQSMANQASAANANHQAMARVAQQYDAQLGSSSTLPAFSTPSQFSPNPPASTSGPGGSGGSSAGGGSTSHASALHSGGGSAGSPALRAKTSGTGTGGSAGYGAPPSIPAGQGTAGGQSSTSTQGASGVYPPGGVTQPGGSSSLYPGGGPASGNAGGDVSGVSIGGMPIGGGFGPGGGAGASYRGGSPGWGPTGSGGAGSGGASSGASGAAGPRTAAGAAAAEESAVETGAAGARGSSGMAGGMGAGRGGKGGGDREHKRAEYLLEPDPESVFGADETAIPRVIGE